MSLDEFNEELEKFKLDLINSEIYKEYIKADRAIYEDKKAIELSESEEFHLMREEVQKYVETFLNGNLIEIMDIQSSIEKYKDQISILIGLECEYLELRMKLKEVLSVLEQGILRSVK